MLFGPIAVLAETFTEDKVIVESLEFCAPDVTPEGRCTTGEAPNPAPWIVMLLLVSPAFRNVGSMLSILGLAVPGVGLVRMVRGQEVEQGRGWLSGGYTSKNEAAGNGRSADKVEAGHSIAGTTRSALNRDNAGGGTREAGLRGHVASLFSRVWDMKRSKLERVYII